MKPSGVLLTNHAQMGLQFDLEPLEGALQLLDLRAGRHQSFRVRDHLLFYCCDLKMPPPKKKIPTVIKGFINKVSLSQTSKSSHLVLVPCFQLPAVLSNDAFIVLADF